MLIKENIKIWKSRTKKIKSPAFFSPKLMFVFWTISLFLFNRQNSLCFLLFLNMAEITVHHKPLIST